MSFVVQLFVLYTGIVGALIKIIIINIYLLHWCKYKSKECYLHLLNKLVMGSLKSLINSDDKQYYLYHLIERFELDFQ